MASDDKNPWSKTFMIPGEAREFLGIKCPSTKQRMPERVRVRINCGEVISLQADGKTHDAVITFKDSRNELWLHVLDDVTGKYANLVLIGNSPHINPDGNEFLFHPENSYFPVIVSIDSYMY